MDNKPTITSPLKSLLNKSYSIGSPTYSVFGTKVGLLLRRFWSRNKKYVHHLIDFNKNCFNVFMHSGIRQVNRHRYTNHNHHSSPHIKRKMYRVHRCCRRNAISCHKVLCPQLNQLMHSTQLKFRIV